MFKIDVTKMVAAPGPDFIDILLHEMGVFLEKEQPEDYQYVIANFRDPSYSAQEGGYHPVEVMVNRDGSIEYITDFSYAGMGGYAELVKELDFYPITGIGEMMGQPFNLHDEQELYRIFQSNFCTYYHMGIFTVTVSI